MMRGAKQSKAPSLLDRADRTTTINATVGQQLVTNDRLRARLSQIIVDERVTSKTASRSDREYEKMWTILKDALAMHSTEIHVYWDQKQNVGQEEEMSRNVGCYCQHLQPCAA
ncbi:hypothetical protein [Dubosiella newyorkensis]|uniref:hypothetical protein n=1 Tax=Dubosiella newyorkensis TaxID=1862672 RepID=UPI003F67FA2E